MPWRWAQLDLQDTKLEAGGRWAHVHLTSLLKSLILTTPTVPAPSHPPSRRNGTGATQGCWTGTAAQPSANLVLMEMHFAEPPDWRVLPTMFLQNTKQTTYILVFCSVWNSHLHLLQLWNHRITEQSELEGIRIIQSNSWGQWNISEGDSTRVGPCIKHLIHMKNNWGQSSTSLLVMVMGSTFLPSPPYFHFLLMQEKSATLQHVCSHQVFPQEHILQ